MGREMNEQQCPACGELLNYDEVDIGVGTLYSAPWCSDPSCGWEPPKLPWQDSRAGRCAVCLHPENEHLKIQRMKDGQIVHVSDCYRCLSQHAQHEFVSGENNEPAD